jgi:predicted nucleic acid-binding protein
MPENQSVRVSLDTNVLLDLASDVDRVHDFRESLLVKGYKLFVVPRVLRELGWLHLKGTEMQRTQATKALRRLRSWGITPLELTDVDLEIGRRFADTLIFRGSLPAGEQGDGRIIGETSLGNMQVLVTSDRHLLNLDSAELSLELRRADLEPVTIVNSRQLLRAIG